MTISGEPAGSIAVRPMRPTIAMLVVLAIALPARAQYLGCVDLDRVNRRLAGHVDDYTENHGGDRRIFSPILGRPRDLYVYTPPGYDPRRAYPLVVYFHLSYVDEHYFVGSGMLEDLDALILRGECPPMVVACPDGIYSGRDRLSSIHSFYVNGRGGRFEDHIIQEVLPFLMTHYAIRPEREAHALLGTSAGGYGAMSLAIRHRDMIGAVATLAAPLNLRYTNGDGDYFAEFNPATYRPRERYDPDQVIGVYYHGLKKIRASRFIGPVFGEGDEATAGILRTNPADLLSSTDLKPGELAMYVHYDGRDEFNFRAQDRSFAWLAAQRGIAVPLARDPQGHHDPRYFRHNLPCAFLWLGQTLLSPTP